MGVHIVLFIKPGINIDFSKLVDDLYNSYKDMGKGVVIEKTYDNPTQPNFIFNSNKELLMDGNNHHITLNIFNSYESIKEDIIEMIWDAFDLNDLEFIRIGFIKEIIETQEDFKNFKNSLFKQEALLISDELELAYHKVIKYKQENLNCWKRYMKFKNTDFIMTYDLNTESKSDTNITYKYIKDYMGFCDNFIKKDMEEI